MEIDVTKTSGEISPLLFGHNLEHTRSCMWHGLSAQIIRDRKFACGPDRDGVSLNWERVGSPGAGWHLVEGKTGWKGTTGEPYTRQFEPGSSGPGGLHRQRIETFGTGEPCGIAQGGIALISGREYEARVALMADREMPVRVRFTDRERGTEYHSVTLAARPGEWSEHGFTFASPAADLESRLEILLDGEGVAHVGAVSLLPADHFHGMRRDVVELLKEIGVPILRWPGGNFAGCYRWKDGLLPVDMRPPIWAAGTLPHTDGWDEHEMGTDEFLALCRELGAEPWLTINLGVDDPAGEAAAWVEYCNGPPDSEWGRLRAGREHPEPYAVKQWSLGNEAGYTHMAGPRTPREYAEAVSKCADAMREVDPSLVFTSSGTWWEEEWPSTVLPAMGEKLDHVSYHEYTPFVKDWAKEAGGGGAAAKEGFRRVATAAVHNLKSLREIREMMDRHSPGGRFVGLSFDEWNVWYAWFRSPGVAEGVYCASMLNMICREAQNVGITLGAFFEPVNEGAILVGPADARLTAMGQVFCLFKSHWGRLVVETGCATGTDDLDVLASVDEAGTEVVVTAVNRSPDSDARAEITLGGVASAEGVLLASPDFLPGSEFTEEALSVDVNGGAIAFTLPKHSVARVVAVCG